MHAINPIETVQVKGVFIRNLAIVFVGLMLFCLNLKDSVISNLQLSDQDFFVSLKKWAKIDIVVT